MNSDDLATRLRINHCLSGISDQSSLHEPFRPAMDPPPFEPVHVRRCIRTNVRIQIHDRQEEVLILTSLTSSVDSILNANHETVDDGGDGDVDYEDGSDISDESSSSSYDELEEEDIMESRPDEDCNNQKVNRMRAYWPSRDPICMVCLCNFFLSEFHPCRKQLTILYLL
jgi:hypothetical protein